MISIMIIECGEVHLEAHLISIGTQMIFGGIGEVIITLCTIIGIGLDCMDTIDGHHLDMIDGDTITVGVGDTTHIDGTMDLIMTHIGICQIEIEM